jgi:hypothetical protein
MISLLRERDVLGVVGLGGDRSEAFEAPIFGLVLFTFAVSMYRMGMTAAVNIIPQSCASHSRTDPFLCAAFSA